jgi:hypothetical protein
MGVQGVREKIGSKVHEVVRAVAFGYAGSGSGRVNGDGKVGNAGALKELGRDWGKNWRQNLWCMWGCMWGCMCGLHLWGKGGFRVGIIILIGVYLVLGFLLAWIANLVANEEVEVKTGFLILIITGILSVLVRIGMNQVAPDAAVVVAPVANFVLLVVLLKLMAQLGWKHSAIIAAIYTAILFAVGLGLSMLSGR